VWGKTFVFTNFILSSFLEQFLTLHYAKTMLLIDHSKRERMEGCIVGEECVSANNHINFTGFDMLFKLIFVLGRAD
jgi:hypothetical protein